MHQKRDASSNIYSKKPMNIDKNQLRSCKRQSFEVTSTNGTTLYATIKLVKILKSDPCISCQQWRLNKLLVTLVTYQKDLIFHIAYRQFKILAYQIMLKETNKKTAY